MSDELKDRIAEVVHDENERLRSENGTRYTPLRYDELPDKHRENRESIAQAVINDLGLHYVDSEEYAQVGLEWLEVEKGRHIVGKWEKQ